jgi:hypothetical protein
MSNLSNGGGDGLNMLKCLPSCQIEELIAHET